MNERSPSTVGLSLSKCWQTDTGRLVFQASLTSRELANAKKGFLTLDPENSKNPISFSTQKADEPLQMLGVAALIRKHCSGSRIIGVALSRDDSKKNFVRLELATNESSRQIFVALSHKPQSQIDLIVDGMSLLRFQPKKSFTVRKPAEKEILEASNLSSEGFNLWLQALESTGHPDAVHQRDTISDLLSPERRQIRDKIARRLKTLKKTLKQDQEKLPDHKTIQGVREDAALLSSHLWMVQPQCESLVLTAEQTGGKEKIISLDPAKNPGENLDLAYKRLQKLEKGSILQSQRVKKLEEQIQTFEKILILIRDPDVTLTAIQLRDIMIDLGLAPAQQSKTSGDKIKSYTTRGPGRTFQLDEGIILTLGRDAKESDQIVKKAKSSDWWIHVAGGSRGSHVIISGLTSKTPPPGHCMRAAGILALHFSDRSQALEGEVYCTRRQFIRKTKGLAPGLWIVDKSETFLIRYTAMDLASIFAKEIRDGIQRHRDHAL